MQRLYREGKCLMAHFLDILVAHDFPAGLYFREFVDLLPSAEMFLADNVFGYFNSAEKFGVTEDERRLGLDVGSKFFRSISVNDLPNIAPPFPVFFVAGKPICGEWEGGCLFVARGIRDNQHASFSDLLQNNQIWSSRLELEQKGVVWVLYALPFVSIHGIIYPPLTCAVLLVMEDGSVYSPEESERDPGSIMFVIDQDLMPDMTRRLGTGGSLSAFKKYEGTNFTFFAERLEGQDLIVADVMCRVGAFASSPSLLAICFLHCSNVTVVEHDPLVSRQMRRQSQRREQKGLPPFIKFHTLEITALQKVLSEQGGVERNGMAMALHLCRGHFKDFRQGPGLFGKHRGLYWWDSQARGNIEKGQILKDYRVSQKEGTP